ncbi:chromosome transmission fidelity protein 8, partial [Phenoliferia sp. Uapishka_3]
MRLKLNPSQNLISTLSNPANSSSNPPAPLAFIDNEPFLIELQGSLELPGGQVTQGIDMGGTIVGKLDTTDPNKPILIIAHHRLEGKLVTLTEPYALLRTTPATDPSTEQTQPRITSPHELGEDGSRETTPTAETTPTILATEEESNTDALQPRIDILALIRRKIVFSKRPEPILELSSDAPEPEGMF